MLLFESGKLNKTDRTTGLLSTVLTLPGLSNPYFKINLEWDRERKRKALYFSHIKQSPSNNPVIENTSIQGRN